MILIVGLGNPGKKFKKTRHNLGFRIIDQFRKEKKIPKFKFSEKFNSLISEGSLNKEKIILAKPKTFMNNSGKAVKLLVTCYQLPVTNLFIIHDDIDLPLGKIRISIGRGSAGHKGVQSIIDELGSKNFVRFRIGIRTRDSTFYAAALNMEKFVLQKFNKKEEEILKNIIKKTCQAIELATKEEIKKAMNEFNK